MAPQTPPSSPPRKQNVQPPTPRSAGAPAILVTISRCVEKRDQPGGFVLYPGTNLYYVFDVKTGGGSWELHRRFSEVKKFWDALRPAAAAAGARLDAFPAHSALLTGQGLAGNYYETSPTSPFAAQRVDLLARLCEQLVTSKNATGGSLFELRAVRAFFEIDEVALAASSSAAAAGDAVVAPPLGAAAAALADAEATRAAADGRVAKMARDTAPESTLAAFCRATPATFCTVFVAALTALFLLEDF